MWFSFKIFYWISSASASNCKKHWTLALDTGIGYWSSNDWNSKIYFASALCDRQKISDHDFSGIKKYEQNCTTASQIVKNCTVEKAAILEYQTGKWELCVKYMCGTFEGTDCEVGAGCQDVSYPDRQNSPTRESHFGILTGSIARWGGRVKEAAQPET